MLKKGRALAFLLATSIIMLSSCNASPSASSPSASSPTEDTYNLIWASTSASSGYYALNVAMANVINDNLDNVNITIMETGGTADNFEYMRDGQAHFGQTTDSDTYLLLNDMGTYANYNYTGARMLCSCFPITYYMTVSERSGIDSIADLQGATFLRVYPVVLQKWTLCLH